MRACILIVLSILGLLRQDTTTVPQECTDVYENIRTANRTTPPTTAAALELAAQASSAFDCFKDTNEPRAAWLLSLQSYALVEANKFADAHPVIEMFFSDYADTLPEDHVGIMWMRRGTVALEMEDAAAALSAFENAQAYEAFLPLDKQLTLRSDLARALVDAGRAWEADSLLRATLALFPDASHGDSTLTLSRAFLYDAWAKGALVRCASQERRCRHSEELARADTAVSLFAQLGYGRRRAMALIRKADILEIAGRPGDARDTLKEALMVANEIGDGRLRSVIRSQLQALEERHDLDGTLFSVSLDELKEFLLRNKTLAAGVGGLLLGSIMILLVLGRRRRSQLPPQAARTRLFTERWHVLRLMLREPEAAAAMCHDNRLARRILSGEYKKFSHVWDCLIDIEHRTRNVLVEREAMRKCFERGFKDRSWQWPFADVTAFIAYSMEKMNREDLGNEEIA